MKGYDLVGNVFGRLTVITRVVSIKPGKRRWVCACSCGKSTIASSNSLSMKHVRSYGCYMIDRIKEVNTAQIRTNGRMISEKKCSGCQLWKPLDQFYRCSHHKSGRASKCIECEKIANTKNRDRRLSTNRIYNKKISKKIRAEMLVAYGGKCTCCKEKTPELLALHHIYNDGKSHRLTTGGGGLKTYKDLKRRGWPQDRCELLCHNCHQSHSYYHYCPHKGGKVGG